MRRKLYRASNISSVIQGYSLAEKLSTAKAYLDNPGFGGSRLWMTDVDMKGTLDLTDSDDPWEDLAKASGIEADPPRFAYHFARVIPTSVEIQDALSARGYRWVRFLDDYPAGAVTVIPVSEDAAEEADDNIDEIDHVQRRR